MKTSPQDDPILDLEDDIVTKVDPVDEEGHKVVETIQVMSRRSSAFTVHTSMDQDEDVHAELQLLVRDNNERSRKVSQYNLKLFLLCGNASVSCI